MIGLNDGIKSTWTRSSVCPHGACPTARVGWCSAGTSLGMVKSKLPYHHEAEDVEEHHEQEDTEVASEVPEEPRADQRHQVDGVSPRGLFVGKKDEEEQEPERRLV